MTNQETIRRVVGEQSGVLAVANVEERARRLTSRQIDILNLGPGLAVLSRLRLIWPLRGKDMVIGLPTYQRLNPGEDALLFDSERLQAILRHAGQRGLDTDQFASLEANRRLVADVLTMHGRQTLETGFLIRGLEGPEFQVEFLFDPSQPELP